MGGGGRPVARRIASAGPAARGGGPGVQAAHAAPVAGVAGAVDATADQKGSTALGASVRRPGSSALAILEASLEAIELSPAGPFVRSWLKRGCTQGAPSPDAPPRFRATGVFSAPAWPALGPAPTGRGRARQRWRVRRLARRFALAQLGHSVYLALGRPRLAPSGLRAPVSAVDRSFVDRAFRQALYFVRSCRELREVAPGRRSAALQAALDSLAEVRRELGRLSATVAGYTAPSTSRVLGRVHCRRGTVPLPIVASRVALPEKDGATVDLAPLLPPRLREPFLRPELLRDPEEDDPNDIRGARIHARRDEWSAYLHRLDEAGELVLILDDECSALGGPCPPCGYFGVHKSEDADRSICNREPQNRREESLRAAGSLLAHAASLTDVQLGPDEVARVTAHDISNYYHVCKVSLARALTNQLGPPVKLADFVGGRAFAALADRCGLPRVGRAALRGIRVRACQGAMPMGDINAVDFGQVAHMRALREAGCLADDTLTTYRGHFPRGDLVDGVVVDDYVIVHRLPRAELKPEANAPVRPDEARSRGALKAYATHGLPEAAHKRQEQVLRANVWGAWLDGDRGWICAAREFVLRTLGVTSAILRLGCCSGDVLSCLLGCWAHILVFRRPAFAFLGRAYTAARAHPPGEVFRIAKPVREELTLLVAFAPLFGTDLRATTSDRLWAIDASPWAGAVVSTSLRPEVGRELWRHRVRKAGYLEIPGYMANVMAAMDPAHLLVEALAASTAQDRRHHWELLRAVVQTDPEAAEESLRASVPGPVRSLANTLADSCGWKLVRKFLLDVREHINAKETRVFRALVDCVAKDASLHGSRHMYLGDSMVELGAQAKGRSPSKRVNLALRAGTCTTLLAGVYLGGLHLSSVYNPADAPTRKRPVRRVPVEGVPPDWLYDAASPDPEWPPDFTERFDAWLADRGWTPDFHRDLVAGDASARPAEGAAGLSDGG